MGSRITRGLGGRGCDSPCFGFSIDVRVSLPLRFKTQTGVNVVCSMFTCDGLRRPVILARVLGPYVTRCLEIFAHEYAKNYGGLHTWCNEKLNWKVYSKNFLS